MKEHVKVFGSHKKKAWVLLRSELLQGKEGKETWDEVLCLLDERLNTRYFIPIERILLISRNNGEGFAVMTLLCSLIEFLQTIYTGQYYSNSKADTNNYKYGNSESGKIVRDFLTEHEPFKTHFTKKNIDGKTFADDFYSNVRCGLLHEAATGGNWVIKVAKDEVTKDFVDLNDELNKIIYRNLFYKTLRDYVTAYKNDVLKDEKKLRNALCRKFDKLCEIDSANEPWWA